MKLWPWLAGATAVILALAGAALLVSGQGSQEVEAVVGSDLHSIAIAPDGSNIWVGGHEAVASSSGDDSRWMPVPTLEGADAMAWAFADETILVAGHPGLSVSSDGGRTFELRNAGLPATDIHALGAGGGITYAASPIAGVMASTNEGQSWEMRSAEAGRALMGTIRVDPADPWHLLAADMQGGVVESRDAGRNWKTLGGEGAMWVSWDDKDTKHIIASTMAGAYESVDGGKAWSSLEAPEGVSIVEIGNQPGSLLAAALQDGSAIVFSSRDGGETWTQG